MVSLGVFFPFYCNINEHTSSSFPCVSQKCCMSFPDLICTWSVVSNHSKGFLYDTSYFRNDCVQFQRRKGQLNSILHERAALNKKDKFEQASPRLTSQLLPYRTKSTVITLILKKNKLKKSKDRYFNNQLLVSNSEQITFKV